MAKFCWTLELYNGYIDANKIRIIMNLLDTKIHQYFSKYLWYKSCYRFFEILNILRIVQYCKTEKIKKYLINCLSEIFE